MAEDREQTEALEERARKREAIGLSAQRPTAKMVVHSPPEAARRLSAPALATVVIALGALVWLAAGTPGPKGSLPSAGRAGPSREGRLLLRHDFSERRTSRDVHSDADAAFGYVGDLYRIRVGEPDGMAWVALGQGELDAYRLEAELRLASQDGNGAGFGGLLARYQGEESFYLLVVDGRGNYQVQLKEKGVLRTIRPWTAAEASPVGGWKVVGVEDDGTELRFFVGGRLVDVVRDLRLPAGDVGLIVGAGDRGRAEGLFDWVALYDTSQAE